MKSVEQASRDSGIPKKLINAVLRQLGGGREAKDSLEDVARHGADGGFSGFTYYTETVKFYQRHKKDIVSLVEEMASQLGEDPVTMVKGFRALGGDATTAEVARVLYGRMNHSSNAMDTQVANVLSWFALEETARAMTDY